MAAIASLSHSYIFDTFKKLGCTAAFSCGRINLSSRDNPHLENNRKAFLQKVNINYKNPVCLQQVHGNKVLLATDKYRGRGVLDYGSAVSGYDAVITRERNLPLAVFTADCLSVFIYDPIQKAAAIVHAGWRPAKENIVGLTLERMKNEFLSRPQDIICGFGPAIRSCCYEVGREFKNYFSHKYLAEREGKIFLDLIGLNYDQLIRIGIPTGNISDCGICTSCRNDDFFSYRKEGVNAGRMMSVMRLKVK